MFSDPQAVAEHVDLHSVSRAKKSVKEQRWTLLWIGICFFLFQVALQTSNGVFVGEFGGHPDEAAHYVTGLMVRDFVGVSLHASPMEFAENFYLHYPKVAFGHWPPVFYIVQAVWTLLFSATRESLMLLLAFLNTVLALTIYSIIRQEMNTMTGIMGGLLFMAFPVVQKMTGMVMTEILLALLSLLAIIYFWRYLKTQSLGDALGFGVFSTLAILTKGDGLALALVPPLCVLFTRQWSVLWQPRIWVAAFLVMGFCGPYYWLTLDMVRNAWDQQSLTLGYFLSAMGFYSWHIFSIPGPLISVVIAFGIWEKLIKPWPRHAVDPKWATMGGLLISVFILHILIPSSMEERNLIAAVPVLLMFFLAGCTWIVERKFFPKSLQGIKGDVQVACITFVFAAVFIGEAFATPKPILSGFRDVTKSLLSDPRLKDSVFLISSDPRGEGAFISEVASREDRPGHIVLRASKILGQSGWLNQKYKPIHSSDTELLGFLEDVPVGIVIIDESLPTVYRVHHHQRLARILQSPPPDWELLGTYPLQRGDKYYPQALHVYLQEGHQDRRGGTIRLNLELMLHRTIEKSIAH